MQNIEVLKFGSSVLQSANELHLAVDEGGSTKYCNSAAFVTNNAYNDTKTVRVYWTGVRYTMNPRLDLTAAYDGYRQSAFGTDMQAGCTTTAHSTCSGSFEAFSFDADYRFNQHFDAYVGARYSSVRDGVASGYCPRPMSVVIRVLGIALDEKRRRQGPIFVRIT
jgi:predicted porin